MAIETTDTKITQFILNDITQLSLADQRLLTKEDGQLYLGNMGSNTQLVTISATAPITPTIGDMYFNTIDNRIHTYLSGSTWDVGIIPQLETIYINLSNKIGYYYNGTTLVTLD